ncbi:hypothetical protein F4604DRAFT_1680173 [Suillus subluteus]|nr:hypothetical protein F4604DRAFT_1680173 [Suillus subluteus]
MPRVDDTMSDFSRRIQETLHPRNVTLAIVRAALCFCSHHTLNPTLLPPTACGSSSSSRVLINNLTSTGQKRKHAHTLISLTQSAGVANHQPTESLIVPPSNEGDIQLNVFELPCLLPETTPSDALDNDLIWSSALLHASDLYTRTSYWDALVAADAVFRISTDLWVLQDWDGDKEVLKLGSYFHVVYLPRSDNKYGVAFLLQSTPFNDKYIFSCASAVGRYESGKHVVISLQQDGRWHCHSCQLLGCLQTQATCKAFASAAGLMTNMQDGHQMGVADDAAGDEESAVLVRAAQCGVNLAKHHAILYLPIPPLRMVCSTCRTSYPSSPTSVDHLSLRS